MAAVRSWLWIGLTCLGLSSGQAAAWSDAPLCSVRTEAPPGPATLSPPHEQSRIEPQSDYVSGDVCRSPLPPSPARVPWTRPLELEDARHAMRQAEALQAAGDGATALLHLRVIERAMPRIADRMALRRADLLLDLGMPEEACDAYEQALSSLDRNVVARARVGTVSCRLDAAHRQGAKALQALLSRYPMLSHRELLRYKLALSRETQGNKYAAVTLLRAIDLEEPASAVARLARRELARLAAEGVRVKPLSAHERLDRAERMLRWAPVEHTLAELEALRQEAKLDAALRARLHVLSAKIARLQGKWDEVESELEQARRQGVTVPEAGKVYVPPAPPADDPQARAVAERRVRAITRGRPMRRLRNAQLRQLVDIAARYGLREVADEAIDAMTRRRNFMAAARFDAAIRLAGLASDEKLVTLLEDVIHVPRYRLAGRYHYARALERLGRHEEAETHYRRIYEIDKTNTRYYAMWAEQRLRAMQDQHKLSCMPALGAIDQALLADRDARADYGPSYPTTQPTALLPRDEARERAAALLEPVVLAHGEAYPWLGRALDLVHLSLFEEAADELNEVYMAWRDAKGSPRLRVGLEAVFTGEAPPRRRADFRLRRARLSLDRDGESRQALEQVAKLVGDPGIGLRFGHFRMGERPRAYAAEVERAARKYGIDPNLLFAVMRVESIYNRRIVSYAGAVGLMQIMPVTGKRIADRLGVADFETTDLLDPRTNLEFSAWYLSSLIDRFDGRLPLAIASYNGGPHNVRLWMRDNHGRMPLDAFLERIPFSQTHRYVRRVLTHYAAYRAQQALPMTRLDVTLPRPEPDPIAF